MEQLSESHSRFRTLLVLGRVSNLPTVWSNCLAGWLLTGESLRASFGLLLGGATLLYTGGMFLNDACDAAFDQAHRSERPIPRGLVSRRAVWSISVLLLVIGIGLIVPLGRLATALTVALVVTILAYNARHKKWLLSPGLMALCRSLLYLIAGAAAAANVKATATPAVGLGLYVLGISIVARGESGTSVLARWPVVLLVAPVPLAFWPCVPLNLGTTVGMSAVLLGWVVWVVLKAWRGLGTTQTCVGRLIAGTVLVDALFVAAAGPGWSFALFALMLALALLLQKRVPAT